MLWNFLRCAVLSIAPAQIQCTTLLQSSGKSSFPVCDTVMFCYMLGGIDDVSRHIMGKSRSTMPKLGHMLPCTVC